MSDQNFPPGWYVDPNQPNTARYYDGGQFTEHTHETYEGYTDPAGWQVRGGRAVHVGQEHTTPGAATGAKFSDHVGITSSRKRRSPTKLVAAGTAAVVTVAAGAMLLTGDDGGPQPPAGAPLDIAPIDTSSDQAVCDLFDQFAELYDREPTSELLTRLAEQYTAIGEHLGDETATEAARYAEVYTQAATATDATTALTSETTSTLLDSVDPTSYGLGDHAAAWRDVTCETTSTPATTDEPDAAPTADGSLPEGHTAAAPVPTDATATRQDVTIVRWDDVDAAFDYSIRVDGEELDVVLGNKYVHTGPIAGTVTVEARELDDTPLGQAGNVTTTATTAYTITWTSTPDGEYYLRYQTSGMTISQPATSPYLIPEDADDVTSVTVGPAIHTPDGTDFPFDYDGYNVTVTLP